MMSFLLNLEKGLERGFGNRGKMFDFYNFFWVSFVYFYFDENRCVIGFFCRMVFDDLNF